MDKQNDRCVLLHAPEHGGWFIERDVACVGSFERFAVAAGSEEACWAAMRLLREKQDV